MSIIEEISGIIFSPQKTLESISKKENITSAFIIVLIASILLGIYGILSPDMRVMFEMFEIEITTTILLNYYYYITNNIRSNIDIWSNWVGNICRNVSISFHAIWWNRNL